MGYRASCQEHYRYRRYVSQRIDAHRTLSDSRRTVFRTRSLPFQRKYLTSRHSRFTNEDRHTGTHRRPKRTFRRYGKTRRRDRFSPIQLYRWTSNIEAITMLDLLYNRRITHRPSSRTRRFTPFQRSDTEYGPQILPFHRDKTRYFPRQKSTPIILGARRRRHKRDVSQRIFIEYADGNTAKCPPSNTSSARSKDLSGRLCYRIRLFRSDTIKANIRI